MEFKFELSVESNYPGKTSNRLNVTRVRYIKFLFPLSFDHLFGYNGYNMFNDRCGYSPVCCFFKMLITISYDFDIFVQYMGQNRQCASSFSQNETYIM